MHGFIRVSLELQFIKFTLVSLCFFQLFCASLWCLSNQEMKWFISYCLIVGQSRLNSASVLGGCRVGRTSISQKNPRGPQLFLYTLKFAHKTEKILSEFSYELKFICVCKDNLENQGWFQEPNKFKREMTTSHVFSILFISMTEITKEWIIKSTLMSTLGLKL